jgi:hypothetical protein
MRSLFIAYYCACLLCPIIAYEPHVCKEVNETPIPVKLLTVQQQRMFYKSIMETK